MKEPRIKCNGCGRRVKENTQAKTAHVLKYHPDIPFRYLAGYFTPNILEGIGYRIGEFVKGLK